MHLNADHLGDAAHAGVMGEKHGFGAQRHCGDHAVDQPSGRDALSPAPPIDPCRPVEVGGQVEAEKLETQEEPAEVPLSSIGPSPGQHLHDDGVGDGERTIFGDQVGESNINRAASRPVVLEHAEVSARIISPPCAWRPQEPR